MIDFLKGILFVRKCLVCGKILPDAEKETALCPQCLALYEELEEKFCPDCGLAERFCACVPSALKGKISFSAHLFSYESPLSKTLIYSLKRKNLSALQHFLAERLSDLLMFRDLSDYTVTFAPRKPKSVREYGFDQAKILAKLLSRYLLLPFDTVFSHRHFSKLQKTLNAEERRENAKKSYVLHSDFERETDKLLIIDDVMTTGSTLSALISLAKEAGYREIAVVTVAKTVHENKKEPF